LVLQESPYVPFHHFYKTQELQVGMTVRHVGIYQTLLVSLDNLKSVLFMDKEDNQSI